MNTDEARHLRYPSSKAAIVCACIASSILMAVPASAGTSTAELTLDRAAVRDLIVLALPEQLALDLPVVGRLTLALRKPTLVDFHNGGVEATIPVDIPEVGWSELVDVRYEPEVERVTGVVRLVPASAVPRSAGPGWLDLAGWLDPVALPRRLDWQLALEDGATASVSAFVQRVTVEPDRLRIELGLSVRNP